MFYRLLHVQGYQTCKEEMNQFQHANVLAMRHGSLILQYLMNTKNGKNEPDEFWIEDYLFKEDTLCVRLRVYPDNQGNRENIPKGIHVIKKSSYDDIKSQLDFANAHIARLKKAQREEFGL